jgi:hypothetical protein
MLILITYHRSESPSRGCWPDLGSARANSLLAETSQGPAADAARAQALADYKDFLTVWKDADVDIPLLKEVRAEYTKLR